MPCIACLVDNAPPLAADATCGEALNRFLDEPQHDVLAVTEGERPVGLVFRAVVRNSKAGRPLREIMVRPLVIDSGTSLEEACALVLGAAEPVPGLVVADHGAYAGVVPMRALLRHRGEAEAAVRENRRFLDLISHEIRSPMNGVLAVAELLQRQPLNADSHAFVRTILDSGHATLRALDDALELTQAQLDQLELDLQPVLLREVMDEVQARWQHRAVQEGVVFLVAYDGDPDLSVQLDRNRMGQLFDKLSEAALTGVGCRAIEVSLQARRTADGLRLTGAVRDTGAGLMSDHVAAALGDRQEDSLGAGLGLALCRRIIARLGGSIHADRNTGAGGQVVFEFLAEESLAVADTADRPAVRGAAHVLVVDDNATNRMVAEALCEMFDCTSECAEDGLEAVEAARTGRFDVILMDIRMPRMDGVEATRAIRALPGAAGAVPIIALTANADPDDAKTYLACGMHSVVEKPIKPDRLLQALNAALSDPTGAAAAA